MYLPMSVFVCIRQQCLEKRKKYSAKLCLKDIRPRCLEIILKRKYAAKLCLEHIREMSITVKTD